MSDWWSDRLAGKAVVPKTVSVREGSTPTLRFTPTLPVPTPMEGIPTPQAQYMATQQAIHPDQRSDPDSQLTMGEAIRLWKGGEAHRKEPNMICPECGSGNVFGRVAKGAGTAINGAHPAPRCYECGWNGMYDQGMEANWVA
jgi:hypothetical protein